MTKTWCLRSGVDGWVGTDHQLTMGCPVPTLLREMAQIPHPCGLRMPALGFCYGTELPDPEGFVQGTGKLLWHAMILEPKAIRSQAFRRLLQCASKHRMPGQPGE